MKRLMTTTSTVAAATALTALLAGCNLAPRYQTPQGAVPDSVTATAAPVVASEAALQQFLQSEQNRRNVQIGLVADVEPISCMRRVSS